MSEQTLTAFLDELEQHAHAASAAEEDYRREIVDRTRELERQRAFGFRRLNLMRSVSTAVAAGKDEEEALSRGRHAFLSELQIGAETEANQETVRQFEPVLRACWSACQTKDEAAGTGALASALKEFEAWFSSVRNGSFLTLMDREIVELPLVEVC